MTWQQDLRRLDAKLAAGTIDHDQHRRQREEILAAVSSSPESDHPTEETPSSEVDAVSPGSSSEATSPGDQAADAAGTGAAGANDPTTLLRAPWQTTAPSPADTELTSPLSAIRDSVEPALLPRGTDGSAIPESRGTARAWVAIAFGLVIAVGAVAGGAWWFTGGADRTAEGTAMPASEMRQHEPQLAVKLPELPGRPSPQNATMTVDRGADLGLYSAEDAKAMKRNGADEVVYRSAAEGTGFADGYSVIAIPTPGRDNAERLTDQLTRTVLTQGFTSVPLAGREGMRVLNHSDAKGRVSVIWYRSGHTVVGVGVSQAAGASENTLRARLIRTLTSVEVVLPVK